MSDCTRDDMRDLLPLLASNGSMASTAEVEAHVAECSACREELALVRAARHALMAAPVVDVARIAAAVPAYRAPVHRDPDVVPIASRRRLARVWQVAAAALIVILGGTAVVARQAAEDPGSTTVAETRTGGELAGVEPAPRAGTLASDPAVTIADRSVAPERASDAGTEMTFGGGLDDLSEDELVAILAALEADDVVVPAEPDTAFPGMSLEEEES